MAVTIEKAEVTLPGDREVKVVRSFRAPRALVYRAYTEPELMRRWMVGYPGWTMPVCEMDVRVGGAFRWRWRNEAEASEFGFFGTFREVQAPSRLAHSETFDPGTMGGTMGGEAMVTVTFDEKEGVTTLTTLIAYDSKESRDAALATGMTDGMETNYQLLDRLIETSPR